METDENKYLFIYLFIFVLASIMTGRNHIDIYTVLTLRDSVRHGLSHGMEFHLFIYLFTLPQPRKQHHPVLQNNESNTTSKSGYFDIIVLPRDVVDAIT